MSLEVVGLTTLVMLPLSGLAMDGTLELRVMLLLSPDAIAVGNEVIGDTCSPLRVVCTVLRTVTMVAGVAPPDVKVDAELEVVKIVGDEVTSIRLGTMSEVVSRESVLSVARTELMDPVPVGLLELESGSSTLLIALELEVETATSSDVLKEAETVLLGVVVDVESGTTVVQDWIGALRSCKVSNY